MAIAAKGQELVDKLCVAKNEKVGVYGFVFHRDGEWLHEVIGEYKSGLILRNHLGIDCRR